MLKKEAEYEVNSEFPKLTRKSSILHMQSFDSYVLNILILGLEYLNIKLGIK